jgi:hypothetical protein
VAAVLIAPPFTIDGPHVAEIADKLGGDRRGSPLPGSA